jgi:hypothetical protein
MRNGMGTSKSSLQHIKIPGQARYDSEENYRYYTGLYLKKPYEVLKKFTKIIVVLLP